ncbi:MAG: bifunctional ADP-dependent NAD(P)H-hydrate dehydratase/NAD(P)H-hydrate epimerase, partial [Gammaproteobacteria bacterium]|nr:bifunctional ADP-dependent NAD(P)H-hydrate dehydratase/NAD(P)H-hydrate epimerase [Gammaproteobacteria bacterium]
MNLPVEIYTAEAVRQIDSNAINKLGIAGYTLMRRAAQAALDSAIEHFPGAERWQIVCGAGNNAGDGYVLARLASQQGIAVSVLALTDPAKLQGDAATAYKDFDAAGGAIGHWHGELDAAAELLVDG